jgi:phospholipase/lecithinase/hemolysin
MFSKMLKLSFLALSLAVTSLAAPSTTNASSWSSWKTVRQLFVFGDSYTQTGFDPKAAQPSPANPFGNPSYPGWTSSNGPNWVGFLTSTYNKSAILTYNLASGGATVDSALVTPYAPTVISVKDQVQTQFLPIYGAHPATASWTAKSSLFAYFIGINDVGNSWYLNNATLYDAIFATYAGLLDQVYEAGARNFLFLSVPPVNLSPLILNQADNGYASEYEGRVIADWNARLANMTAKFKAKHAGVTTFVHDTNALFTKIIKDPKSFEQTAGLRNVTGYCKAYAKYVEQSSCTFGNGANEEQWHADVVFKGRELRVSRQRVLVVE